MYGPIQAFNELSSIKRILASSVSVYCGVEIVDTFVDTLMQLLSWQAYVRDIQLRIAVHSDDKLSRFDRLIHPGTASLVI